MPESIEQYFSLSLRQRALIIWALCEKLLDTDEEGRLLSFPNLDWDDAGAPLSLARCPSPFLLLCLCGPGCGWGSCWAQALQRALDR